MIPRVQYQQLSDALDTVSVNAQALAAADLALGALAAINEQFSAYSLRVERRHWHDDIADAVADIQRYRGPFVGMPGAAVNDMQWDDLRHAIGRGYNRMWVIQAEAGDESELHALASYIGDVAGGTIESMPGVISSALHFVSGLATDAVGGVASGLLPLWPLVLIAAAVVVGGAVVFAAAKRKKLI